MATPGRTCSFVGCKLEIPKTLKARGLCIDHYLEEAFQKLDQETYRSRYGQSADHQMLEWLAGQAGCIVDIVREETTALDPANHTRFLELLLGIANLNEHVRHHPILIKHVG